MRSSRYSPEQVAFGLRQAEEGTPGQNAVGAAPAVNDGVGRAVAVPAQSLVHASSVMADISGLVRSGKSTSGGHLLRK